MGTPCMLGFQLMVAQQAGQHNSDVVHLVPWLQFTMICQRSGFHSMSVVVLQRGSDKESMSPEVLHSCVNKLPKNAPARLRASS